MRFGPFFIYTTSVVVAAGGLWAVLVIGSHLSAAQDLSGTWTLRPLNAAGAAGSPSGQLRIEQSGQFMWLFAGDTRADLRMIDALPQQAIAPAASAPAASAPVGGAAPAAGKTRYLLAGGNVSATFELIDMPDVWKLTLVGLEPGVYQATRESPTPQPADQTHANPAAPSSLPSATSAP